MTGREFEITEVGGVRTAWADVPGRSLAVLTFRVGIGDESLAERGLTHMCEHLAIAGFERPGLQVNGFVDLGRTVFLAHGEERRVWEYLEAVTAGLSGFDAAGIDRERDVLSVEQGGLGLLGEHCLRRYGARSYGVAAFIEFSLRNATSDDLNRWASQYFVSENAALWSTMEPPDGLDLALPSGSPRPPADAGAGQLEGPGLFRIQADAASVGLVWPREIGASSAGLILQRRLTGRLRHAEGMSYGIHVEYQRTTKDHAHVVVSADCSKGDTRRAFDALQATILELADEGPSDEELEWHLEEYRASMDQPDGMLGVLDGAALSLLLQDEVRSIEDIEQMYRTVEHGHVQQIVRDSLEQATWQAAVNAPTAGLDLARLDTRPEPPVTGETTVYTNLYGPADLSGRLRYGPTGVSLSALGATSWVRFDGLAAVLRWGDGTRALIGEDGQEVTMEPTRWLEGEQALAVIDRETADVPQIDRGFRYREPAEPVVPSGKSWTVLKVLAGVLAWAALLIGPWLLAGEPLAGAGIAAALVVLAWLWADTRVREPLIYESVQWRVNVPGFPTDAGTDTAAIWPAPFLGWAIEHGRLDPGVIEWERRLFDRYEAGRITLTDLYLRLGGVLATDMFTDETNEFAHDALLATRRSATVPVASYVSILDRERRRQGMQTVLDLVLDPNALARLSNDIQAEFERWRRWRWPVRLIRLVRLNRSRPDRGSGAGLVRRYRRMRWRNST